MYFHAVNVKISFLFKFYIIGKQYSKALYWERKPKLKFIMMISKLRSKCQNCRHTEFFSQLLAFFKRIQKMFLSL